MKYFKGVLIVGSTKKKQRERVIYTRGHNILSALDISHKIRTARWESITEINHDEYIRGVQDNSY